MTLAVTGVDDPEDIMLTQILFVLLIGGDAAS
jgi:hypothetical protein